MSSIVVCNLVNIIDATSDFYLFFGTDKHSEGFLLHVHCFWSLGD